MFRINRSYASKNQIHNSIYIATIDELIAFILNGRPHEYCVYHFGHLAKDRGKDRQLSTLAATIYQLSGCHQKFASRRDKEDKMIMRPFQLPDGDSYIYAAQLVRKATADEVFRCVANPAPDLA